MDIRLNTRVDKDKQLTDGLNIGLDKSGYQVNSFLISRRKHVGTH